MNHFKYLLLFVGFFIACTSQAQITNLRKFQKPNNRYGFKAAVNFSDINFDLGSNTTRRQGLNFAVFFEGFVSRKLAIQPEFQYSSEGWVTDNIAGERESKLTYLNVTTVAKYHIVGGLNLQGGFVTAYMLDATEQDQPNSTIDEELSNFNLAAVFGLGYDFPWGLRFGGRFIQGMVDINDGFSTNTTNNKIKTSNLQLFVSWGIKISKRTGTYGNE